MTRKETDFQKRWMEGADELARLYVSLRHATYEQYEQEFLALQRKMLARDKTDWERQETRRRIAEELLLGAYGRNASWPEFGRALRRIHRLGYSSLERRMHVAVLFARWAQSNPSHLPAAQRLVALTERHFSAASPKEPLYEVVRKNLEMIRQEIGFVPARGSSRAHTVVSRAGHARGRGTGPRRRRSG